jgi:hypothetical protein
MPSFFCYSDTHDSRYLASFSPKISVDAEDTVTRAPLSFVVNATFSFVAAPHSKSLKGTVTLSGDWPKARAVSVPVELQPLSSGTDSVDVNVVLRVSASDIHLWWPAHYGSPFLHTLLANVSWDGGVTSTSISKRVGFRSVALDTGSPAPRSPTRVDPTHSSLFVGCFRDGNIYCESCLCLASQEACATRD